MSIIHVTKDNYEETINKGLILVDFFATWCGPCKMLSPVLEQLDGIDIVKIDVDESPELAKKEGILSIPTLLLFNDGELKARQTGFMPKEEIEEWIEKNK